jgi:hypothetical protein
VSDELGHRDAQVLDVLAGLGAAVSDADSRCCAYGLALDWYQRQLSTGRRCLYRECPGCLSTFRGDIRGGGCRCDSIGRVLLDPWTSSADLPDWRRRYAELPVLVPWDVSLLTTG